MVMALLTTMLTTVTTTTTTTTTTTRMRWVHVPPLPSPLLLLYLWTWMDTSGHRDGGIMLALVPEFSRSDLCPWPQWLLTL